MDRTDQMKEVKTEYDSIEIPKELSGIVEGLIQGHPCKEEKIIKMHGRKRGTILPWVAACAAAFLCLFTIVLNTNTAFAQSLEEWPVIGSFVRIFTFRSYVEEEEDVTMHVEIPSVEMKSENEETGGIMEAVNQEINALCEQYSRESMERAQEYRKAFLETGGTEEEWAAHDIQIDVGYEILSKSEKYLSFVIQVNENWASAYDEAIYYTMDLEDQRLVTLEDILGEGYAETVNQSIRRQMKEREEQGITFFDEEKGGFSGVTQETAFYVNEKGNPVIVFEKYEIAPGAYGVIEFEIMSQDE